MADAADVARKDDLTASKRDCAAAFRCGCHIEFDARARSGWRRLVLAQCARHSHYVASMSSVQPVWLRACGCASTGVLVKRCATCQHTYEYFCDFAKRLQTQLDAAKAEIEHGERGPIALVPLVGDEGAA